MLDRVLVAVGYTSSSISRGGRSPLRLRILIAALFLLSVLPTIAISLITIPSETSYDDLRAGRYRGLGWLRLEGDLRAAGRAEDGRYLYTLHDPADDTVSVTVYAPGPLPTGATQVTPSGTQVTWFDRVGVAGVGATTWIAFRSRSLSGDGKPYACAPLRYTTTCSRRASSSAITRVITAICSVLSKLAIGGCT